MGQVSAGNIPYTEYQTINRVLAQHRQEHAGRLKAFIVFGDILDPDRGFDVQILEVVEDWNGVAGVTLQSDPNLPVRGRLSLYFLTPEQFENAPLASLTTSQWTASSLLEIVRHEYAVFYEAEFGYVRRVLEQAPVPMNRTEPSISAILSVGR